MELTDKHCIPCQGGVPPMTEGAARAMLEQVPGWELIDGGTRLRRTFTGANFARAQAMALRVGELAEAEGHHPDICYGWGYCTVVFYTHKIGGLHENDFIMAAKVGHLLER
jgi:4a-hydroxytetrahydrobiopterin dehydratase